MLARQDAPMVRQGDRTGQVLDGDKDRCFKPRLGWVVATLRPL